MLAERLRRETARAHAALERRLSFDRAPPDLAGYRRLLERKTGLLVADLAALGVAAASLARCPRLPPLRGAAEALGSMYVLEGATLGGQVLRRRFAAAPRFDGAGLAFLESYRDQAGPMWRAFRERLNRLSAPAAQDLAARSARLTFALLGR